MKNSVLKVLFIMLIAITVCVITVSCGGNNESQHGTSQSETSGDSGGHETTDNLSLNLSYIIMEVGENANIIAFNYEGSIEWSSSNPNVCEVTDGHLNAKAEGGAIITARSGENVATCRVVVQNSGVIAMIEIENPEISILLGSALNIGTKVTFKGKIVDASLTYKSEDVNIATVDVNGRIVGVSAGVTYVNIYDNTRGLTETVKVTVRDY